MDRQQGSERDIEREMSERVNSKEEVESWRRGEN